MRASELMPFATTVPSVVGVVLRPPQSAEGVLVSSMDRGTTFGGHTTGEGPGGHSRYDALDATIFTPLRSPMAT